MRPFGHRDPGPIGAALADDARRRRAHLRRRPRRSGRRAHGVAGARAATAEPRHRCRGRARAATSGRARRGRRSPSAPTACATPTGVLAGSVLSLDQAVRNLVAFTGLRGARRRGHGDVDAGRRARAGRPRPARASVRAPTSRCSTPTARRGDDRRRGGGVEVVIVAVAGGRRRASSPASSRGCWRGAAHRCSAWPRAARRSARTGVLDRALPRAARSRFAAADAVLLDEYLGLPPGHPQAYRTFIRRELTDHVDLPPGAPARPRRRVPPTCRRLCARYERAAGRARRRRRAAARHRLRRPHRLQRAGLVARLAHAHQDADRRRPAATTPASSARSTRCRTT